MDEELLTNIINNFPSYTTNQMLKEYNEQSSMPAITYAKFLALLPHYTDAYNHFMNTKEERNKKIQLALQDAEDALIANAALGDIRSIEFLLKSQNEEYMDKRKLEINSTSQQVNIVQVVQDKLSQITNGVVINPDGVIAAPDKNNDQNNDDDHIEAEIDE